ncbi:MULTISPECIES: hypothetical protein [unclassified Brenneria]|uniref:hypothetical protein n=1 Tax=unclassified Brenneria TaxID=2634434 RepID=UPI0029C498A9|nr:MULTISPECIES: hypothetical protein [unclassified Brenneria]MDX5626884.1 hypothetical protein [Brenneria sp. L3-3Z]MDX5693766.1 hypothetical protein [Brenneria sp. L4-2C]MEE3661588.1 hypothetical protein [Brenneria sp. g21c3]
MKVKKLMKKTGVCPFCKSSLVKDNASECGCGAQVFQNTGKTEFFSWVVFSLIAIGAFLLAVQLRIYLSATAGIMYLLPIIYMIKKHKDLTREYYKKRLFWIR